MHRLALAAALLMPAAIDCALLADRSKAIAEVQIAQAKNSDKEELGLGDLDQLVEEADKAEEDGSYEKAIGILEQILSIEAKFLGPKHIDVGGTLNGIGGNHLLLKNYKQSEDYLLRALSIAEESLGANDSSTGIVLENLGELYKEQRLYNKAMPMYLRVVAIREKLFGKDHLETSYAINSLAGIYTNQGLYSKAEPLYMRALVIAETELGTQHQGTATVLKNLGSLYEIQGLYSKAENFYLRALANNENDLGPEHPDTASSLDTLAGLYFNQDLYSKAEKFYLRSLAIKEKKLGPDHPDTASSLDKLADLYFFQDLYSKAEPFYLRSFAIKEKKLGPDHPVTASSLDKLADLYFFQHLYNKAEPFYLRSLAIKEKKLGSEHPDNASSLDKLADLYFFQDLYSKAEPIYLRSLAIKEKKLGSEHPDTASSLEDLGLLYSHQALYSKANSFYSRALSIKEKALGTNHPDIANILNSLATLYYQQGLHDKAEELALRSLSISESVFGAHNIALIPTLDLLANIYSYNSDYEQAEKLLLRALSIENGISKVELPERLMRFGHLYLAQSNYKEALKKFAKALLLKEQELGANDIGIVSYIDNLGLANENLGKYLIADSLYQRSLSIRERILGSDHPELAMNMIALSSSAIRSGEFQKAEDYLLRSLSILESFYGNKNLKLVFTLNLLADLYSRQGLLDKAEQLYLQALHIRQNSLLENHLDIADSLDKLGGFYKIQNNLQKSIEYYSASMKIRDKALGEGSLGTGVAVTLSEVADLVERQSNYELAETILLQALELNKLVFGNFHEKVASNLEDLAYLYSKMQLYEKSEDYYLQALSITKTIRGNDHFFVGSMLYRLAHFYEKQNKYEKAESLFLRSLEINEKTLGERSESLLFSINGVAMFYKRLKEYSLAAPYVRKGLQSELALIQREAPYLLLSERQVFLSSLGSAYEIAFSFTQQNQINASLALFSRINRHGLLEEIEKRQAQLASLPGPQQETAEELRGLTQQLASMSLSAEQRKTLRARKEELEKQLYRLLPELEPRIVEVDQVAKAIPSHAVLVEFQRYQPFDGTKATGEKWSEARYLALILNPNGNILSVDLGLAEPIEDKIQQALRASEERLADAQELWNEIGALVVKPLAKATASSTTWFVSPDAELNRIPFAALSAPQGDQLLGEAVNLRLLTTGRELLDLAKSSKSATQKPLVVANPNFDRGQTGRGSSASTLLASNGSQQRSADLGSSRWKPLPGTAKEGQAVSDLTNAQLLMGDKATALAVQQQAAPKVLHLASHAYFLADQAKEKPKANPLQRLQGDNTPLPKGLQGENPLLRSGIVLAGANQPNANSKDDGYLTALEVAKLDWQGTEMVVVSGCESGKGEIQAGEGVYGLKRAIAVSGARSSLLSLWKVDDAATAAFMQSFYERLKAGEGRADSLAATQQEFREHKIPGWRHPYVWAAFQLSGDWKPVQW